MFRIVEIFLPSCLSGKVSVFVKVQDGDEIKFGEGEDGDCPNICNLHLAVAQVSAASVDLFDIYLKDDDIDEWHISIYFGGPFVSDDVLIVG